MNKKVFLFGVVSSAGLVLSACSLSTPSGVVSIDSPTNLPVPQVLGCVDNTVSWNSVPNASRYIVKINDVDKDAGIGLSYTPVFDHDTQFTFCVKAVGGSLLYSDSAWSPQYSFEYKASSGTQTKTKLDVPTNISFMDNTVFWSPVSQAIGYEVKIDDQTSMTAQTEYRVSLPNTMDFWFSVRALSDADSNLGNSSWSIPTKFHYVYAGQDSKVEFDEKYQVSGIGKSINLITGKDFQPAPGVVSIFDTDKLYTRKLLEISVGRQESCVESGYEFGAWSSDWQKTIEEKVGLSASVSLNLGAIYLTNGLDMQFNKSGRYHIVEKSQTKEFYFKMQHNIIDRCVYIDGYKDFEWFSDILSATFKSDAKKVELGQMSPAQFVSKYGTHVIMGAYYGGNIDARYGYIGHAESTDVNWYESASIQTQNYLLGGWDDISAGAGGGTEESVLKDLYQTQTSEDFTSYFDVRAIGGNPAAFGDVASFFGHYGEWVNTVKDNTVLVDFPNESLFCVWDYLSDEYMDAKQLLNAYLMRESNEIYEKLFQGIGSLWLRDSLEYDLNTKTVNIDYSAAQRRACAEDPNAVLDARSVPMGHSNWVSADGITVYPYFDEFSPVERVRVKGAYGLVNSSGQKIQGGISNFSLTIDESFGGHELDVEIENVNYESRDSIVPLHAKGTQQSITLTVLGENKIIGNGVRSLVSVGGTLCVNGSDASSKLEIRGLNSAGKNGSNGIECATLDVSSVALSVFAGSGSDGSNGINKDPNADSTASSENPGGNGQNGFVGGSSVVAKSFTANRSSLLLAAGDGGNGGNGGAGEGAYGGGNSKYIGGRGGQGGKGGDAGAPLSDIETLSFVDSDVTLHGGRGGNGGSGGQGGNGHYSYFGCSGQGGPGGNGGAGGNSVALIPHEDFENVRCDLFNTEVKIGNFFAGNGGEGGTAGSTDNGLSRVGGSDGGHGGSGGSCIVFERDLFDGTLNQDGLSTCGSGGRGGLSSMCDESSLSSGETFGKSGDGGASGCVICLGAIFAPRDGGHGQNTYVSGGILYRTAGAGANGFSVQVIFGSPSLV